MLTTQNTSCCRFSLVWFRNFHPFKMTILTGIFLIKNATVLCTHTKNLQYVCFFMGLLVPFSNLIMFATLI